MEKDPDRRGWEKVARLLVYITKPQPVHQKIVAGIVGIHASVKFFMSFGEHGLSPEDVLVRFAQVKKQLANYELHQLALLNDALVRFFETDKPSALDHDKMLKNLKSYLDFLSGNHEAYAHLVSLIDGSGYHNLLLLVNKELPDTYKQIVDFIKNL